MRLLYIWIILCLSSYETLLNVKETQPEHQAVDASPVNLETVKKASEKLLSKTETSAKLKTGKTTEATTMTKTAVTTTMEWSANIKNAIKVKMTSTFSRSRRRLVKPPGPGTTDISLVSMTTDVMPNADSQLSNVWYVSDDGSDDNDCHSASTPCRNLQTVLDRATDGADIYVTSDTLSLDGQRFSDMCVVESPLSYTISHPDNIHFQITCSENFIQWRVSDSERVKERGLPTVIFRNANFTGLDHLNFILQGLIHLNKCSFSSKYIGFDAERSMYEPQLNKNTVGSFKSNDAVRQIKVFESQFLKISEFSDLGIGVFNTTREFIISQCYIVSSMIIIQPGATYESNKYKKNDLTFFSLHIINSSMSQSTIEFFKPSKTSFVYIKMVKVNMFDVYFVKVAFPRYGRLVFHVENTIWENNFSFYSNEIMFLDKVLSVSIISSELTGNCNECPVMHISGVGKINQLDQHFLNYINYSRFPYTTFTMVQTTLKAQRQGNNRIYLENSNTILRNNIFITGSKISFKVQKLHKRRFEAHNIVIQCLLGQSAETTFSLYDILYSCHPLCEGKYEYSLHKGRLVISENVVTDEISKTIGMTYENPDRLIEQNIPSCLPCPTGASCEDNIQALPNFWGYMNSDSSVSMIRCPDGYCCQDNETCKGIDSCNTGRTGTLCGTCDHNLTESIFTPNCVHIENCRTNLVITLFIAAALTYTIVLLSFSTIKTKLIKLFKKGYNIYNERCQNKVNTKKRMKQEVQEVQKADYCGMKYIQIPFYYVQDSKLFIIQMPETDINTEHFVVKFFSPGILEAYVQAKDVCFQSSSAIAKVALECSFGFLVMICLSLLYIIQLIISFCSCRHQDFDDLKVKLIQAFVMTVLLSFQKLVIGAFTLIQCVDIRNQKVSFIQADIQCYTWWQIGVFVYVCISIVPTFFVLSHVPFYVKDRKMSVRTFILICLFPLPILVWYHVLRLWNKCFTKGLKANKTSLDITNTDSSAKVHRSEKKKSVLAEALNETEIELNTLQEALKEIDAGRNDNSENSLHLNADDAILKASLPETCITQISIEKKIKGILVESNTKVKNKRAENDVEVLSIEYEDLEDIFESNAAELGVKEKRIIKK